MGKKLNKIEVVNKEKLWHWTKSEKTHNLLRVHKKKI